LSRSRRDCERRVWGSGRVPAVEAERRPSAQKGDHRRNAPHRAGRADSGPSRRRPGTGKFDPKAVVRRARDISRPRPLDLGPLTRDLVSARRSPFSVS